MHHFPFHITDIDHATARLTMEEFGGYVRMMMAYLKSEKPLSNTPDDLDFVTGARTTSERRSLQVIVKRFFAVSEDSKTLKSDVLEDIIADYRASGVQSRFANLCRHWDKANKGLPKPTFEAFSINPDSWFEPDTGRVRKVTARNPLVLVSESADSPTLPPPPSQPITNNQEPITIGSPIVPKGTDTTGLPDFDKLAEAIYAIYPKKVGKTAALKAIVKVLKAGSITEQELQAAVRAYRDAVAKWPEQDNAFVPHPATWFNQGRYADDPATWIRHADSNTQNPGKKERGGAAPLLFDDAPTGNEHGGPKGWREAWPEMFAGHCPDSWLDVPPSARQQLVMELTQKNKGGARP